MKEWLDLLNDFQTLHGLKLKARRTTSRARKIALEELDQKLNKPGFIIH